MSDMSAIHESYGVTPTPLKPCPFCGSSDIRHFDAVYFETFCHDCGAAVRFSHKTPEGALENITNWNRRTPPCTPHEVSDAEVEAAAKAYYRAIHINPDDLRIMREGYVGPVDGQIDLGDRIANGVAKWRDKIEVMRAALSAALAIRGK